MKRIATVIFVLLALALPLMRAQDNVYGIDNICYEYFNMCESLVEDINSNAFEMAADALLKRAGETGDTKSVVLHSVMKLKRVIRFARFSGKDREQANEEVDRQREETVELARQTGYRQYLYYAYTLCQTYYVNTNQEVHAQNLLNEMMETSRLENDEYGLWQSQSYLSLLYSRQNDLLNVRKHLLSYVNIYENTSDELIRRQSITRQCCDLADTYPRGSDSARLFYNKAELYSRTHNDTLRLRYYKAQVSALDKQLGEYIFHRDYCLGDPAFFSLIRGGEDLFECIDGILEKQPESIIRERSTGLQTRQQLAYLRDLAIVFSREDVAAALGSRLILSLYTDISRLNNLKTEEMSVAMHNNRLQLTISRLKRTCTWLWIVTSILAAGLLASIIIIFKLKDKTKHIR